MIIYKTKPFHTPAIVIAVLSLSMIGCRSGRPSNSMVQITEDPDAIVVEVPAPQQRLATSSTGKQNAAFKSSSGGGNTDLASAVIGMPAVFRDKPNVQSPTVQSPTPQMSLTDLATAAKPASAHASGSPEAPVPSKQTMAAIADALANLKQPASHQPTENDVAVIETTATKPSTASPDGTKGSVRQADDVEVTLGGLVSASLTDLSSPLESASSAAIDSPAKSSTAGDKPTSHSPPASDLVRSKSNDRPTVTRRPISQTEHPNSLTVALEQSLAELPTLPQASHNPNALAPTRIGTGQAKLARQAPPVDDEPSVVMNANQVQPVSHAGDDVPLDLTSLRHSSETETFSPQSPVASPSPPSAPDQPLSEKELYQQLLAQISREHPGESPTERERRQIIMSHLMVLAGRPDEAVDSMKGLNPTEQLYLKNQLQGLWTMINPEGHPSSGRRITEALPKFREATRYMASVTDSLSLRSLEFCTEIESYGQIKPFDGNRFVPGQQVILYCEVENFAAAERENDFETQLQGSYDIYNAGGTKVISQLLPVDQQRSRNRLRDYFVAYQMNLPKTLPPGTYRLQLTLEDVVGKKYGQANIPFEIH